ncbi:hypothetical protein [Christiangramia sabulilitoris]|uniref:Uncharacterized protein n=1 Tax=Christiangramia sabulilitoris TaxID=2583991 RepID=A0A550I766_9FLAO|nr:hypothetical protein [Christiangramia sabulilitoris]TRO66817.1 hypothetical protein FGM01_02685 [Christiangramia sabulilitoris]
MNHNFYFILILIFCSVGCKETVQDTNLKSTNSSENTRSEFDKPNKNIPVTDTIIKDDLVYEWIEELLNKADHDEEFSKIKKPVENRYNPDIIDTLINLNSQLDQIKIYSSDNSKILKSARIQNDNSDLKNLKIGMSKSQFNKVLKENISSQIKSLIISNLEQTNIFEFQFQDQILTEINYYGYLD